MRLADPPLSPKYAGSFSGGTFASASNSASPRRHDTYSRISVRNAKSMDGSGLFGSVTSMMNGAASMRNPATPSWSQKPMIFLISSRTAGWAMLKSGWNL
jgi:hypothetical protein